MWVIGVWSAFFWGGASVRWKGGVNHGRGWEQGLGVAGEEGITKPHNNRETVLTTRTGLAGGKSSEIASWKREGTRWQFRELHRFPLCPSVYGHVQLLSLCCIEPSCSGLLTTHWDGAADYSRVSDPGSIAKILTRR